VNSSKLELAVTLAKERGVLTPKDLESHGIPRQYLHRLEREGLLARTSRGIYTCVEGDITEYHSYAEVCKHVPHGVICLSTALLFHNLTTQSPWQVWLAIPHKAHRPRMEHPSLRLFYMSGLTFTSGVEEHRISGATVRVFNVAKTVVDCFRFRNKIGIDVAVEALKEFWFERRGTMDELCHYADICRVHNVMHPYLQML